MQAPLLASQGPTKPEITKPEQPKVPTVTSGGFEYAKPSNGMGASMAAPSWDSAF